MSEELKPCPFCGNEPAPYWKGVGCVTSGCLLNGLHLDADKWNRRAQPAEAGRPGDWEWLKLMAEVAEQDRPWNPRLGMTDVEMAYAQSASPSKVLELIAALSSVTAERDRLREAFGECIQSLHDEMLQSYGGQKPDDMHPVTRRNYDRDMAEIAEYRAAMAAKEA